MLLQHVCLKQEQTLMYMSVFKVAQREGYSSPSGRPQC